MLTQYQFSLSPDHACSPRPEWGYRLYAAMLELAPIEFGTNAHQDAVTPVSQHLVTSKNGSLVWTVNLLGEESERALCGVLEQAERFTLEKDHVTFEVTSTKRREIEDTDALFALAERRGPTHTLLFETATAFKSRGCYLSLPTARLILQSLVNKWNGCITDCPIEDEDGEGVETIAAGLRVRSFRLHDRPFYLKGNSIPGFVGEIGVENRLDGFHRRLADALLLFSDYAGVGIKTALGMGGVKHK